MVSHTFALFAWLTFMMCARLDFASATLIKPRVYEIRNVSSTCSPQELRIRLELNRNFKGIVYAKGFPLEKSCRASGTGQSFVDISIDASGCGVRLVSLNDEVLTYRITLNVQTDKFLQQINDLEVTASCNLQLNLVTSNVFTGITRQISRTGRNKASESNDKLQYNDNNDLNEVKSWMEIEGISESRNINKVVVGEQTMMLVKSFLPETMDANVVDCYAYDGTRDVIQKLLDENGCPLDETIMPSLEHINYDSDEEPADYEQQREFTGKRGKTNEEYDKLMRKKTKMTSEDQAKSSSDFADGGGNEKMRLRVMGTLFSAFKFPDTSNLHMRCILQVCKSTCLRASCESNSDSFHTRLGKSVKPNKNSSNIIEKIEVFNSVEVLAPGIDADDFSVNQDDVDGAVNLEENSFCLSTSKMAIAFAILGAVFLCGVLAVLWTVMRNHMRKSGKMDGSEQILVVRDSPLNFRNARNKLYHNWSYS